MSVHSPIGSVELEEPRNLNETSCLDVLVPGGKLERVTDLLTVATQGAAAVKST